MLLDPYGTEHRDILRERYVTHSICAICPCSVEPAQSDSDADQLAELREFLAISPQSRLDAAVEAGDFRFLGVPDFVGLYTPCYGYPAMADTNPDDLHVIPQTLNVQLSDQHAELNRRAYVYARRYNHLLLFWLPCSEEIPLIRDHTSKTWYQLYRMRSLCRLSKNLPRRPLLADPRASASKHRLDGLEIGPVYIACFVFAAWLQVRT